VCLVLLLPPLLFPHLQMLSTNTRRTKVVELSTGTHRVPDELRKHYLSDGEGGQYSTNLDRNRYGNDDQYLFTGEAGSGGGARRAGAANMAGWGPWHMQSHLAQWGSIWWCPIVHRCQMPPLLLLCCCSPAAAAAAPLCCCCLCSHPLRSGVPQCVPLHGGRGDHRRQERPPVHLCERGAGGLHLP
jgi:hypothetical protein